MNKISIEKGLGIDQSELAIATTKKKIDDISADLFIQKPEYEFMEI